MSETRDPQCGECRAEGTGPSDRYRGAIDLFCRVGALAASDEGADAAMGELIRGLGELLDVANGSIMLVDPHIPHTMTIRHATGLAEDVVRRTRIRVGRGVAGTVAQTGEPMVLAPGERHPDSEGRHDASYSAAMCVPLKVREQLIGVLSVRRAEGAGTFGPDDLRLLQAVAGLAAPSIELARMVDTLQERIQEALAEIQESNALIRQAREQLERVLESAPSPALVMDDDNRLMLLNIAAENLLGVDRTLVQFRRLQEVVQGTKVGDALVECLTRFQAGHAPNRIPVGDPVRQIFQPHIARLSGDDDSGGHVVILADITELEELSQLKSDLVSMTSHELRSPLTSIKGAATTLLRMADRIDDAMRRELSCLIVEEADRLNSMVTNILDISRIEAGRALDLRYVDLDVAHLIDRVVARHRSQTTVHELTTDVPAELPHIHADGGKIEQVLINLISNAIKYSPDGGPIRVCARSEGAFIRIEVCDQGLGISEEDLPTVFQRYRRVGGKLARSAVGAGLGLYLSRGFVEAHGGRIEVTSKLGEGSTFSLVLPVTPPEASGLAGRQRA